MSAKIHESTMGPFSFARAVPKKPSVPWSKQSATRLPQHGQTWNGGGFCCTPADWKRPRYVSKRLSPSSEGIGAPVFFSAELTSGWAGPRRAKGNCAWARRAGQAKSSRANLARLRFVTVLASSPPAIAIFEPLPGPTVAINASFDISATATDSDGTIAKVEFFQGTTKLGQQTLPELGHPTTYFWTVTGGLPAGTYTFTAKATDNSGVSTTSAPVTVEVTATPINTSTVFIATPGEDTRLAAPTSFTGVIAPAGLTSWSLQYRLRPPGDDTSASLEPWRTAASGTAPVGTAATSSADAVPGVIGTFDPTLLLNGLYELRLLANATTTTTTTSPVSFIIEANMKVGAFTLAFEDLKVPLAGVPITVTRTYDSRDARVGDFGPGWHLAVANIRVQKNRNLGTNWFQTLQAGSSAQYYYVEPIRERLVTVAMPDGETHRFRAGAYVKSSALSQSSDPDNASYPARATTGQVRFYALGDTTSKLEPLDASNQLAATFFILGTGYDQDLWSSLPGPDGFGDTFNPTRFRLTTKDGSVFILDESLGLLEMRDLNGNTLALTRDIANRVTGLTSTLVPAASGLPPVVTTVTVHRDATGRVDYITDPAAKHLDYLYDTSGRLASFTNRELNITQFRYENPAFPYYLTKIIDPRGVSALRTEFDAAGKLIKQIDADGKETLFTRGTDGTGRFEKVKDRLGNESTFYYDARGNVTLKLDPLGAQTNFSYYPDSDWVKLETDHYGNVKSMAYDERGNVTVATLGASASEDPANPSTGYITRTTYNEFSSPTRITDPDGRVQSFTYATLTNDLLSHTLGAGGSSPSTTNYTYNSDGTQATITDALGNVTNHAYDYAFSDSNYPGAVKQITEAVTDPAGSAGSDASNPTATVLRVTRTLFNRQESLIAQIISRHKPDGSAEDVVTRYEYDSEQRLQATIMPDGRVTEMRYTSFGKEDKMVLWRTLADYQAHNDTLARITSYGYDSKTNPTSMTFADGTSEAMHFDEDDRKDWSQDRRGNKTYFQYDAVGRLRYTLAPDATPADLSDNPRSEIIYDLIGRERYRIDERSTVTEFTYENNCGCAMRRKQMIQVRATTSLTTSYTYDNAGNVRFVTDPRGNTTETRYDDQGRQTLVVYPATDEHPATQAETRYDKLGRRIAMIDQEGKITRSRYDGLGRLVEVRQYLDQSVAAFDSTFSLPLSSVGLLSTRYTHDELGNQQTQTDALGRVTTYWTDGLGRRTQRILPKDSAESSYLTETLQYEPWGNLWKRADFAGKTTTFAYDVLNRLTSKTADATHPSLVYSHAIARIEYDYDAAGSRSAARTYNASNTPLYSETTPRDERDRLAYKDTAGGRLSYAYYANNQLKDTVSSNVGGVNLGYRYDDVNRLEFVDDTSTGLPTRTTGYTYNANGSLEKMTAPNGVAHTYVYDPLNRLRTLTVAQTAGLGPVLHAYDYKLRASGHRRQVIEGAKVTTYTYDEIYRLTGENVAGVTDPAQNGTLGYTLDKVGNRSSRLSSFLAVQNQTNAFNARDWLASDTYTANGSTTVGQIADLADRGTDTYDFEEHLILRTKPDGSSINVSYDADGNRIAKNLLSASASPVSSTSWLVDTNNHTGYAQVFEERVTTGGPTPSSVIRVFTYGSALISQATSLNAQPSTLNYYTFDGHGSVRELTDAAGNVTDRYDYDAFGNLVFRSGTTPNAYLYCGEQFDTDLALYYNRARYLNANSGRFWGADTYEGEIAEPGSLHRYLYANSDPVEMIDPSGNSPLGELLGAMNFSQLLDRMATVRAVQTFRRITGKLCSIAAKLVMPYNKMTDTLGKLTPFQKHHIFKDASMRDLLLFGYTKGLGLAIPLLGGSQYPNSPHARASAYQKRVAKYNWPASKVAYGALLAAGCSVKDARQLVKAGENYNDMMGWRIPK